MSIRFANNSWAIRRETQQAKDTLECLSSSAKAPSNRARSALPALMQPKHFSMHSFEHTPLSVFEFPLAMHSGVSLGNF